MGGARPRGRAAALRDVNWQAVLAHAVRTIGEDGLHFHDLRHINAIDAHVEPEQGHTDHVSIASRARRGRQGPLAVTGLPSARC
jgi:hypothetical protein